MTIEAHTMTTNTYGGYTVVQLREFIRHHYDAEHGGDNIDELTNDSSASVNIVRDLLDAIEPQQDGDLLRPVARWVYNAVRVNLDLLHGICAEHGCPPGEDVSTWLRATLARELTPFQQRVQPWMLACFGAEISADRLERTHRFFEEAGELVQACGMTREEAHALVDYTWSRPVGEPTQEVGGVMVTLAALCLANDLDMHAAGETELARINVPATIEKIRAKQAAKPKHSPLPGPAPADAREGLTNEQIEAIANDGYRNAAGGIYATSVHAFARACISAASPGQPEPAEKPNFVTRWSDAIRSMGQPEPHGGPVAAFIDEAREFLCGNLDTIRWAIELAEAAGNCSQARGLEAVEYQIRRLFSGNPEPRADVASEDQRDGKRWRALMKNGEPEVFVERMQRRAIQRTQPVGFSSPNLTGADRFDIPSEMWVKRYVMFAWWARENEHRKFIEAVDAIAGGTIQ